ncbi:PREDICTED: uncharacterized protein LOC108373241 [Rhagoletis zephyria]|uniref:uncharacterized protein LOC108373241 n=1 Tax=Rhagoletis zephyria TaxID=28612 RepID=UPI0008113895|nr:PREDICTED: uncharacterized protein LOC108373241 [Rhagoletis zephyria]
MCDKSLLLYKTATVTAVAIAVLTLCVVMPAAAASADAANSYVSRSDPGAAAASTLENLTIAAEMAEFRNGALIKIDNFLQYSLPQKMRAEGEDIRAETVQEFDRCAQLATTREEIWRFKECAGKVLGNSMKSLALLVEQAYRGSGAAALGSHAFWWSLLKLVAFI